MDALFAVCAHTDCGAVASLETSDALAPRAYFCSPTCLFLWHSDTWSARAGASAPPPIVPIRVKRVIDGDTIEDSHGVRYRLAGIDAPERAQPEGPGATRALEQMLAAAAHVGVRSAGKDKYRRVLGTLFRADDAAFTRGLTNINADMVAQGWAWAYAREATGNDDDLLALERDARADKRGFWAMEDVEHVLPHDYRRSKKTQKTGRD